MRVDVYTRHDAFIKTIAGDELLGFVHTDELNGSDSVEITTRFRLCEGYRLIWKDRLGKVHEHVCQDPQGTRASDGSPAYTDTALNSICELMGDYIDDKRPYGYSFRRALEVCLEPTRWQVGTVDQTGTVSDGLTFYHTDCRSALNAILECGGELETEISVSTGGAITRKVGIRQHRGDANGHRRFEYGKDLASISRTEHWGAITACYGYGKGLETESGGYGRKLTFGDINNGKDYVADSAALKNYGRPDGKGGFCHVFGKYENSQCEDASQLKSETQAYLDAHKEPGVTYEADVIDLVAMGRTWEGVGVGDDVQIVDTCFDPVLRCQGRVSKLVTNLLNEACEVTLGNVTETLSDIWERQQSQIAGLQQNASNWDVAATTPGAYLQQIIDGLNAQFNTQGMSYCFTSFEQGTIWSSVPLDDQGRPTRTGGSAIQVCSQGFRIASGTKSDGSYDWRTFGTGEGFTADEITAGTLNAGLVKAGALSVKKAGQTVFEADFDSGDVTISGAVGAGDTTVGSMVVSCDVQYGLSDSASTQPTSWTTTALWQQGKHMWTRTKVVLVDGTVEYSAARRITNEKGIGASEVTEQYYLSTSSTTQTGGSWQSAQPTWVTGRYYWTRSKITWSDGTVTYTTPVLARALTSGNQATDDLDESLTQQEVFNRLTNNGQTQGIFLKDGKIYINGEYIKADTVNVDKIISKGQDATLRLSEGNYNTGTNSSLVLRTKLRDTSSSSEVVEKDVFSVEGFYDDIQAIVLNGNYVLRSTDYRNDRATYLHAPGIEEIVSSNYVKLPHVEVGYSPDGVGSASISAGSYGGSGANKSHIQFRADGATKLYAYGVLYDFRADGIYRGGVKIA